MLDRLLWESFDVISYISGLVFGTALGAFSSWILGLPQRVLRKVRNLRELRKG